MAMLQTRKRHSDYMPEKDNDIKRRRIDPEVVRENHRKRPVSYLPPECIVKILLFCDAKTVCRFSLTCHTAYELVERNIKHLAVPRFVVGIYNHRGFCLRNGYVRTRRFRDLELLNNELSTLSILNILEPFKVEYYKHKPVCEDRFCRHRLLYRHMDSGIYIFPGTEPLPTVLNCKHKNLRVELSLYGITAEELTAIHRLIISTEPNEVNVDLYPVKRYRTSRSLFFRRTYPFHYFMTDCDPQLCVQFWDIFRERLHSINLRDPNLENWLTSFFLDFLAQGNVNHAWFAFPPLGTEEDEPIAFAIIRLILEQWPMSKNTPIRAMVTLPHFIGVGLKPQIYVSNVEWTTSSTGGPQCTIKHNFYPLYLRIRLFRDRLFLAIEDSRRDDFKS